MSLDAQHALGTIQASAAVDLCAITLNQPSGSASNLSILQSLGDAAAKDLSSLEAAVIGDANQILNALNPPIFGQIQSLVNGIMQLKASLTLAGLPSSMGASVLAGIIESIIGKLIDAAINAVEQQALKIIEGVMAQATQLVEKELSALTADVMKDLSPVIKILNEVEAIIGKIEADKALVQAVLTQAQACPAKAALMAEAYFKKGPGNFGKVSSPTATTASVEAATSALSTAQSSATSTTATTASASSPTSFANLPATSQAAITNAAKQLGISVSQILSA